MTRRNLLHSTAGILLSGTLKAQSKTPGLHFPSAARDRLAVASYPFREYIQHPRAKPRADGKALIPLTAFPALVVSRFGVKNIEPLNDHFASREPQYLKELLAAHQEAGARIINIPFSPRGSLYDPDDAKRRAAVEDACRWVDAAVAVQSPSVRAHIEGLPGVAPNVEHAAASLQAIARYGSGKHVVINLENDDPKSEEAGFITRVIEQVNSPWLRALPDFCNSMLVGDTAYNDRSLEAMFHHAYNISHVKDSEVDAGKVFRVDVPHIFHIAKASGYRGYFSIEWEGEEDPFIGTRRLIDQSLKALAA